MTCKYDTRANNFYLSAKCAIMRYIVLNLKIFLKCDDVIIESKTMLSMVHVSAKAS